MTPDEKLARYLKLQNDMLQLLSADQMDAGTDWLNRMWQAYGLLQRRIEWLGVPGHE